MWKGFAIALVAALAAVSCSHNVSRIRTNALASPNPTRYSFPLPVEEVHAKALQAFSREHQGRKPIFGQSAKADRWVSVLFASSATNTLFAKSVFADPANAQDIFLHGDDPFVISSVYRGRDGGLPFMGAFHLHLASSGSETVVSVRASETRVVNGMRYGLGSCGPGWHLNYVTVRPTTVEEYTILSYLGHHLGITNMPPVISPAQ